MKKNAGSRSAKLERQPHRPVRPFLRGRIDDLRPVQAKETSTLLGHVRRHDAGERIAAQLRLERERDPGVSAGGFQQMPPRLQLARCFGRIDHRLGNPILDGAGGVLALELRVEADGRLRREARSSTSGVEPIRSRRDGASAFGRSSTAGHRRQEDHGLAVVDRRLEPSSVGCPRRRVHVHERTAQAHPRHRAVRRVAESARRDHRSRRRQSPLVPPARGAHRPPPGAWGDAHGRHQRPPTGALQNST